MAAEGTPVEFTTQFRVVDGTPVQVIRFTERVEILASTILNGGVTQTDTVLMMQVPKDYNSMDPLGDITRIAGILGLPQDTVGFMTAAEVEYVFNTTEHEYNGTKAFAAVTAGLSNQVVAGEVLENWEERHALSLERSARLRHAGTINILAISPVPLTVAGKVNAVICATEAKTAALNRLGYRETGTTSDAIGIVSPIGGGVDYAGTASDLGIALARSVRDGVAKALIIRDDFPEGTDNDTKLRIRAGFGL